MDVRAQTLHNKDVSRSSSHSSLFRPSFLFHLAFSKAPLLDSAAITDYVCLLPCIADTVTQIVGGIAARRYGGRVVLLTGVGLWSAFTMLTPAAAASGMPSLLLCRVLMGLGGGVTMVRLIAFSWSQFGRAAW